MEAQRRAGFEVSVACSGNQYSEMICNSGFKLYPIPFKRSYNLFAHYTAYRHLRRLFTSEKFTIVHTHTPIASIIGRYAAQRSKVPVILYTAHGFYFHDDMKPWMKIFHVIMERRAQKNCDFLFTQSREDYQSAITNNIAPKGCIQAIGNGVNLNKFHPLVKYSDNQKSLRNEVGLRPDIGPIIILIGRLVREKGYHEFFRAFASISVNYPKAHAVVVGMALPSDHDACATDIHCLVEKLNIQDRISFLGMRQDVHRLMALGDIYCLPSWREGMPRSIIEAMATGIPVIATDIRGSRELVVHGVTGLLSPVRDHNKLVASMDILMRDVEMRKRMGEAGRRRAVEYYDERIVIKEQLDRMKVILAEKGIRWPRIDHDNKL